MSGPVVRGGRTREQLEREAKDAEAQAALERREYLNDVRALMHRADFQRFLRYWLGKTGAFAVLKLFTAEAHWMGGRREVGVQMWNDCMEADPAKVKEMLDVTTPKETE